MTSSNRKFKHILLCVLCCTTLTLTSTTTVSVEPEARIYSGAEANTEVTLSDTFAARINSHRGCHARVTDAADSLGHKLMWHMGRWSFVTTDTINEPVGRQHELSIGFFCADGTLRTYDIVIKVSQRNDHPPMFGKEAYDVYVPADTLAGSTVLELEATDPDVATYNHELVYSLEHNVDERYAVTWDGHLRMIKEMTNSRAFVRQQLQVRACDRGSPQLCASTLVNVYPVTVSAPHNVVVNVATRHYQIIEWQHPKFGKPEKYRIYIRTYVGAHISDENPLYYAEVEHSTNAGNNMQHMARVPLDGQHFYALTVSSVDKMGETPSAPVQLNVTEHLYACSGRCHPGGGRPACFARSVIIGTHNTSATATRYDQFSDGTRGPQCVCYDGFVGSQCAHVAECPPSLRTFDVGALSWPATKVNVTASTPCAYGPAGNMVRRSCVWNRRDTLPEWQAPNRDNLQQCRTKPELLAHLSVLRVVFFRGDVPNVAAMSELLNTVRMVLPNAILDPDIAKTLLSVLGAVLRAKWERIPMHTAQMRLAYRDVLLRYAQEAAVNLQPTDIVNMEDDIGVTAVAASPNRRVSLGPGAYIEFRSEHLSPRSLAVVYMRNSTFYPSTNYPFSDNAVIELMSTDELISSRSPDLSQFDKDRAGIVRKLRHSSRDAIDLTNNLVNVDDFDIRQRKETVAPFVSGHVEKLTAPIRYAIRPPNRGYHKDNYTCVYFSEHDREWRTDGVYVVRQSDEFGMVVCETWHLSAFSILQNRAFRRSTSTFSDNYALETMIACLLGVTICGMVLIASAVLTMSDQSSSIGIEDVFLKPREDPPKSRQSNRSSFTANNIKYTVPFERTDSYDSDLGPTKRPVSGRLSRHNRGSILACLVLTKMALYTLYGVANAGVLKWSDSTCEWLGIIQQWCVLSIILWMCIEAGNLFKLLRKASQGVDHPRAPCALIRKAIVAWGLPTIIVAVQVILSLDDQNVLLQLNDEDRQRCAPPPSLAFYLMPSLLFLLIDTVLFVCVWIRFTGGDKSLLPQHVNFIRRESALNFALMILFTLTWGYEMLSASAQHTALEAGRSTFLFIFGGLIIVQEGLLLIARCSCVGPPTRREVTMNRAHDEKYGHDGRPRDERSMGRRLRRHEQEFIECPGGDGSTSSNGVGHISPQTDDTNSNLLPIEASHSSLAHIQTAHTDTRFNQNNHLLMMQQSVTSHDFNGADVQHQHYYQPPPPPPPPRTSLLV